MGKIHGQISAKSNIQGIVTTKSGAKQGFIHNRTSKYLTARISKKVK